MSLSVRPATPADLEAAARVYALARPGNPATHAVLAAEDAAQRQAGAVHGRWVAEMEGEVVGTAEIMEPLGSRAAGRFGMELAVLEPWRGQGAGGLLFRTLSRALADHQPSRLKAVVSEANPVALRFAARHGFTEVERFWDRTLDLRRFDPARHTRPLPEGVELTTLAAWAPQVPDVVAALYPLYEEARADLPRAPGEAYTALPPEALRGWLAPLDPALFLLAVRNGQPLGFTALEPSGAPFPTSTGTLTARPGDAGPELMIAMTGVARAERRQGLARALKVASMAVAREAGWGTIRTSNHSSNLGMLQVNDRLGFGREPARLGMVKVW